jgi:UPF0271 protein
MKVDLNADLGESFGNYKCGMDEEVIKYISSANVACGFHASDPLVMSKTVKMGNDHSVAIGAHPGYPDMVGFGRRNMDIDAKELKAVVQYQIGALQAFCSANHVKMQHVKPHGAMYNMAAKNEKLASAIAEAIYDTDSNLILLGLSGSLMIDVAKKTGLRVAHEVFADRAYQADGTLVPRSKEGAVIQDENAAVRRTIQMVKKGIVIAVDGTEIPIHADSVCLHGDGEKAVLFAKMLFENLTEEGIEIVPLEKVVE